jgi:hypothetical protein
MTLFPQINTDFIAYQTDDDLSVKEMMEKYYAQSITINQSFWSEADIDSRFRAGDQTLWNDIYGNLPAFRRRVFNFNRIRRVCNMISGYQRNHRKSIRITPIENSDEETADQFTQVILWAMEADGTLDTISQAFDQGACTTGMNLLSVWMDYREDPINGNIRTDNVSYNAYLIDPFFRKHDLSDCNFIWTRKWLTKPQLKSLLPERRSDIDKLYARGNRDGKFQFMPEAYNYGMEDLLTYDEFWYRSYRTQKMLVDVKTGETMEWKGLPEDLDRFVKQFPEITTLDVEIPTCKLAIVAQGVVMYDGPNPMGIDSYPFVPVLGYYDPQIPYFPYRIQGVVRGLRDSQYLYNRRKVIELDILESQINSGFIYKPDSLVNPKDIYLQGQGRGLAIKQEAQMSDVEQIQPPNVPGSMIELSKILGDEIQQISGVNEELLGSAEDDKAGILAMLRQGAGLTTLQILFDQLDYSQKLLGRLYLELIQSNFSPGKVQRIINEQPSLQFYSKAFGKFDAVVEEGMNTSTQRQMQFAQLMEMRGAGIEIPQDLLIKTSTLQNKEELIEAIGQNQAQAEQIQAQQLELQFEEERAKIKDLEGRAQANAGLALERASRVQENRALAQERLAEAQHDRDLGALAKTRAMKELEGMDIDQIQQLFSMLQAIQSQETPQEAEEEASVQTPNIEELAVLAQGEKDGI